MAEESNEIKDAIEQKEQADHEKEQQKKEKEKEQTFLYEGEYLTREQIDKKKRKN